MAKKMNNSIVLRILIVLGSLTFVAGGFYVLTDFRLDAVENNATKIEESIEDADAKFDVLEDSVSIIQYDIRHIKDDLREQKEISKQILMELRK